MVYLNRNYEDQAITQKSNDIRNISRAINDWLISRTSEVIQLSQVPLIQTGDSGEIKRYLTEWRSRLAFIYGELYFVELDGSYWNSSGHRGKLENRIFVTRFTEEIPRYFYMGPVLSEPRFDDAVVVAAPITRGEKIVGVLAAVIPVSVIDRMLGFFTFSEFDSYMLVDQFGRIITHSDHRHSAKSEKEVYGREFTRLCRFGESMVFVNVLKTTWKFVTFQPRSVLLRPIKRINVLVVIFFFVVVAILLLVSYTTTSRIVRPILNLTEGVERIMSGDYRQHIHIGTSDEMKTLADSFNRLSDRMIRIRTDDRFIFLGHIAARMAHEMRKPLHIIQLATISMEAKRRFGKKHTSLILREVENADRFLKEILNFTKPDMLNLQKYSLLNLWKKILPKYRLVAKDMNIALDYRKDKDIPPFCMDIIRMEEVFSNLLDNAFEAVQAVEEIPVDRENGRRVSVELKYLTEEGVLVSITDTGPGFREEVIDKAFDPYFSTKENGTGLGLSISYRILSGHGAKIDLKNTEAGHGRVEILFPL